MLKVRMLARYGSHIRKLEQGLEYLLPVSQALDLVHHGLAELVLLPVSPPVAIISRPPKAAASRVASRNMRSKAPAQSAKTKKKP